MSLSVLHRGGTRIFDKAALIEAPQPGAWLPRFRHWHDVTIASLLVVLIAAHFLGALSLANGATLLLVGGALIGIPHGSSDFVVAHRVMAPRFGRSWLLRFLALYLAIVGAVMTGWFLVPLGTFFLFLLISGLHFGADERGEGTSLPGFLACAMTPIVPILLCHAAEVAGIIGLMSHCAPATVVALLTEIRPAGLVLYIGLLGWTLFKLALDGAHGAASTKQRHACAELLLLAIAATVLPALVTFAVYFCLIHAVRHMAHLATGMYPRRKAAATQLVAAILFPSALVCLLALRFAWDHVAGLMATEPLLALALQITAALTVPHVLLEWWSARQERGAPR